VDYIGIANELREATAKYTKSGGEGEPAPDVETTARPVFLQCLEQIRTLLPEGENYGGWRKMSGIEVEDLYSHVYGHLAEDDELREDFLKAELRLSNAFLLVKQLYDCPKLAHQVFCC